MIIHVEGLRKLLFLYWEHRFSCRNSDHLEWPSLGQPTQVGFDISLPHSNELPPALKHELPHCLPFLHMQLWVREWLASGSTKLWTAVCGGGPVGFPTLSYGTAEGGPSTGSHHPDYVALCPPCVVTRLDGMELSCVCVLQFQTFGAICWYKGANPGPQTWSARQVLQWLWNALRGHLEDPWDVPQKWASF